MKNIVFYTDKNNSVGEDRRAFVFIDVFRACSTIVSLLSSEIEKVILMNPEKSGREDPDEQQIVFSEMLPHHYDNSPLLAMEFARKTPNIDKVHFLSGNLSKCLFNYLPGLKSTNSRILLCCFLNLRRVRDFILENAFSSVEIIAAGHFDEGIGSPSSPVAGTA